MEDRKKLYTKLQHCNLPLEVEQYITTKLVSIYAGKEASENVNVTKPVNIGIQLMIEFQQNLSEWFHERLSSNVIKMSERKKIKNLETINPLNTDLIFLCNIY